LSSKEKPKNCAHYIAEAEFIIATTAINQVLW